MTSIAGMAPPPAQAGPWSPTARFTASALAAGRGLHRTEEVHSWLADRMAVHTFSVTPIPFTDLDQWTSQPESGNLVHASGRFFTVEGLQVKTDYGPVQEWSQPIVNQPEIGILGILVKEFDGVLHCLMSAKMEPGNVNLLQVSPTVQATRSNYTRAHRGSATAYLEYFLDRVPGSRVLVDVLQSEQGSWFHGKRNRNMVVEIEHDIEIGPDYCWMTFHQLFELLSYDNLVNMDARTVLSCVPFAPPGADPLNPSGADPLAHADLLSWFTEARTRYFLEAHRVPLDDIRGWHRTATEIAHDEGRYFRVIAVSVAATNREVASWTQPLIAPCEDGLVAMFVRRVAGELQALLHIRVEPGYRDTIELAPTVQATVANYTGLPPESWPPLLARAVDADPASIRYDTLLSEEGGRFHHALNRYRVIEVDESFEPPASTDFRWVPVGLLTELLRHSHYVNVQARSLVASLHSLWAVQR
ncbi:NDP-hexose 2,3-dehydratase family protein [Kitasatospora sp. NPDC101235]|uniref:NDP-hexose 2,3-dehydratase family protein n=1 Tax=Kitasatospora sp. NPDC101235 TaxID=3364101 RepID=UPI00382FF1A3